MSLESVVGMNRYLAANDKKTAGEIPGALGKTTKLSVSDSVSRDRDDMQQRSVSRRMPVGRSRKSSRVSSRRRLPGLRALIELVKPLDQA